MAREEAREFLLSIANKLGYIGVEDLTDRDGKRMIEAIKVLQEPHWIPCSERLPKDGRQVLVYARSVHYALAKYDEMREADGTYKKQWVTFDAWKPFYTIKEVIAWMPLPEAWRGDAE